jgi:hypothetical protein
MQMYNPDPLLGTRCSDASGPCDLFRGDFYGRKGEHAEKVWLCTRCMAHEKKYLTINNPWMPLCRNYKVCKAKRNFDTGDNISLQWSCE